MGGDDFVTTPKGGSGLGFGRMHDDNLDLVGCPRRLSVLLNSKVVNPPFEMGI